MDCETPAVPEILQQGSSEGPSIGLSQISAISPLNPTTSLPVIVDGRALATLLEIILNRSGLSLKEVARRMGYTPSTIRQYVRGRNIPGMTWFYKFTVACGASIKVEMPPRRSL